MTIDSILSTIVLAVVGGSGFVGLVFFFVRRYIEKKITDHEVCEKRHRDQQFRRLKLQDSMERAKADLFFWVYRAISTGQHNGELEEAWNKYMEIVEEKREFEREIIMENQME